jgi:hypothetical protein
VFTIVIKDVIEIDGRMCSLITLLFVDVGRRKSALGLCQNCVTYPPKPWVNATIYGDTSTRIDVA